MKVILFITYSLMCCEEWLNDSCNINLPFKCFKDKQRFSSSTSEDVAVKFFDYKD